MFQLQLLLERATSGGLAIVDGYYVKGVFCHMYMPSRQNRVKKLEGKMNADADADAKKEARVAKQNGAQDESGEVSGTSSDKEEPQNADMSGLDFD